MKGYKPIPGFPNYLASRVGGKIYSLKSRKVLKVFYNINGRPRVRLFQKGDPIGRKKFVYHLVALCWVHNSNPATNTEINHLDFNIHNSDASNLEWTTRIKNMRHNRKRWFIKQKEEYKPDGVPF